MSAHTHTQTFIDLEMKKGLVWQVPEDGLPCRGVMSGSAELLLESAQSTSVLSQRLSARHSTLPLRNVD